MKKLIVTVSLISTVFFGACYKAAPNNAWQTETPPSASPVAGKSVEPPIETAKTGDYDAAMNFYNAKDYPKAAAEFEAVVKKDAKNQKAHFNLGKSYQALKKPDEAVGAYKKAIEIKPDYAEANFELGKLYLDKKDYETSLPFIEKAAKINYTSTDYLIALGDNYRYLNRCNYAVVPYGKVNGFDDKNTAAYYGMGLCYIELKNRIAAGQQVRNLEQLDKTLAKKLADQIPK